MPDTVWLKKRGQIETCRACELSFALVAGESTSVLIHRYTAWREQHADCRPPEEETPDGDLEAAADDPPHEQG